MRRTSTLLAAVTTVAVGVAAIGPATAGADTSNTVSLKKAGDTRLTLDKNAGAALKSLGIRVAPVKPSKVAAGAVVFPITSGSVDPKLTDGALINHSGGLRLSKGRDADQIEAAVIDSRLRTLLYERRQLLAELYPRGVPNGADLP